MPSGAVDPSDPSLVHYLFWGNSEAPSDPPADRNVDLYIAQSRDGGATFLPGNTLHLTDAHLGDEQGTKQVLPAITIDSQHRVHILWYAEQRARLGTHVQVKYARIDNFSASITPSQVFSEALTPVFSSPRVNGDLAEFRDYYAIAVSDCAVYAAYMSADEGSMNIYVSVISPPCAVADVTADGTVNANDIIAFGLAFPPGLHPADVNHDGVVNAQDAVDFLTDYSCGGCPH